MKIFIISFLLIIISSIKGFNEDIIYSYTVNSDGIYSSVKLILFNNNLYKIIAEENSSDNVLYQIISSGYYSLKNGTLILNDTILNFQQEFITSGDILKGKKTMYFFYKNDLAKECYNYYAPDDDTIIQVEDYAKKYKFYEKKEIPLKNSVFINTSCSLNLSKNKFEYKVLDFTLLKGTWTKKTSIIYLYDSNHTKNFTLFIKNDSVLDAQYLPGNFELKELYAPAN